MTYPTVAVTTTNVDAGSDSAATARADILDALQKLNLLLAMFSGTEVLLAAAATTDIGNQTSQRIALTSGGGTTITSLGVVYGGPIYVRTAVACNLTHNATTLVCPNSISLALQAGDRFLAIPKASGGSADGWAIIPAPWSMTQLGIGGVAPGANATLALGRRDAVNEGGQLDWHRSSDNTAQFSADVYLNGAENVWRLIDNVAGATRLLIDSSGRFGLGFLGAMTADLDIGGTTIRQRTARTPASSGAAGNVGEMCWDATYEYRCIALNTWQRTARTVGAF